MGPTFMVKDGKPSYTPMRQKCDAIIKLKAVISVKDYKHCVIFPQRSHKTSHTNSWVTEKEKQVLRDGIM